MTAELFNGVASLESAPLRSLGLVLMVAMGLVFAGARSRHFALSWALPVAAVTAALVALVSLAGWAARSSTPLLGMAAAGVLTCVTASVIRSAARRSLDASRWRAPWVAMMLGVVRLSLAGALALGLGFALLGGGLARKIDDRVEIERGYLETVGGAPGTVWHPDQVRLQLWIDTPRSSAVTCVSLGGCAAQRGVVERYGGQAASVTVHKLIVDPPASVARRIEALLGLAWLLVVIAGLCLERVLASAVRGRPFAPANVWWLRALALAVGGVLVVVPWLADRLVAGLAADYLPGIPEPAVTIALWPLLLVALFLALAEIWRFGGQLQQQDEATV